MTNTDHMNKNSDKRRITLSKEHTMTAKNNIGPKNYFWFYFYYKINP